MFEIAGAKGCAGRGVGVIVKGRNAVVKLNPCRVFTAEARARESFDLHCAPTEVGAAVLQAEATRFVAKLKTEPCNRRFRGAIASRAARPRAPFAYSIHAR